MSSSRGGDACSYLIVIDGLPEPYTWQDLKDFVRPQAEHEFWADLSSIPNGTGYKRGCVRTQRPMEAQKLYNFLTHASPDGRRLRVVLWDITQSPPKQIAPKSTQAMSEMQAKCGAGVAGNLSIWQSVAPAQGYQQARPTDPSPPTLAQSMEHLSLEQRQQFQAAYQARQQKNHLQQQQQQRQRQAQLHAEAQAQAEESRRLEQARAYYAAQAQPIRHDSFQAPGGTSRPANEYVSSQSGTPINVRDGVALTVSRGVFVSGLNYKAREEDVKRKFSSVGDIVKCTLLKDSSGKSKGVATLLFNSACEAQKAVDKYHHATWMEKTIKVRIDRETMTLSAPPQIDSSPLIVNGSRVQ